MFQHVLERNRECQPANGFHNVGMLGKEAADLIDHRWILPLCMSRELLDLSRRDLTRLLGGDVSTSEQGREASQIGERGNGARAGRLEEAIQ